MRDLAKIVFHGGVISDLLSGGNQLKTFVSFFSDCFQIIDLRISKKGERIKALEYLTQLTIQLNEPESPHTPAEHLLVV